MKKIIFVLMLMPMVVFGITCETVKDNQEGNSRSLVCDNEKSTTTTFKTSKEETVLENSVCKITCSEEVIFSVDPIKKVLSGTSFNYPLYASGERKCKAVYNYQKYEAEIKKLVSEYATLTGTAKSNKANEITNYYAQKKACDEFTKEGSEYNKKYEYNGDVSLKVETSINEEIVPYEFKEISEYSSNVIMDEVRYDSCNYNETAKTCQGSSRTISGWTETAKMYGKYTMNDAFIEKYTGEIKNTYSGNTCNAGDRYFVSMNELTRPVKNDTTDKGYKLTLTATKLGNNLVAATGNWKLNVECWYKVKNLIFPQNNPGGSTDENYEKYGGTAFQYRIIDLDNPFPERNPGANWVGKEDIIYSTKDNLTSLQRFIITLDRSKIIETREYNDLHSYDTFNLNEMEKSSFIEANPSIIIRR